MRIMSSASCRSANAPKKEPGAVALKSAKLRFKKTPTHWHFLEKPSGRWTILSNKVKNFNFMYRNRRLARVEKWMFSHFLAETLFSGKRYFIPSSSSSLLFSWLSCQSWFSTFQLNAVKK